MPRQGPRWPTLVVAVGNPLCGDDGFGPLVLRRLRELPEPARQADLLLAHTDLLAHLDRLAQHASLVLVDAVLDPTGGHDVRVFEELELLTWPMDRDRTGHQISPLLALRLLRVLYPLLSVRIHLVGLCITEISLGRGLAHAGAVDHGVEAVLGLAALHGQLRPRAPPPSVTRDTDQS